MKTVSYKELKNRKKNKKMENHNLKEIKRRKNTIKIKFKKNRGVIMSEEKLIGTSYLSARNI